MCHSHLHWSQQCTDYNTTTTTKLQVPTCCGLHTPWYWGCAGQNRTCPRYTARRNVWQHNSTDLKRTPGHTVLEVTHFMGHCQFDSYLIDLELLQSLSLTLNLYRNQKIESEWGERCQHEPGVIMNFKFVFSSVAFSTSDATSCNVCLEIRCERQSDFCSTSVTVLKWHGLGKHPRASLTNHRWKSEGGGHDTLTQEPTEKLCSPLLTFAAKFKWIILRCCQKNDG